MFKIFISLFKIQLVNTNLIMKLFGKKKINELNLLELTPFRKHEHRFRDDGSVEILIPRFKNKKFEKLFLPKKRSPFFILHLDEIGSETWLNIDGKNNVQNICNILIDKFGDKVKPAEERAGKFISTLHQHGYLDFKEFQKPKY